RILGTSRAPVSRSQNSAPNLRGSRRTATTHTTFPRACRSGAMTLYDEFVELGRRARDAGDSLQRRRPPSTLAVRRSIPPARGNARGGGAAVGCPVVCRHAAQIGPAPR